MKIKKLSPNVQSKLLSSIVITDAVQCVLELVYNSLDAEATAVAVTVDLNNYKIQVFDNGRGIDKGDLELVGQRYMTTKYKEVEENRPVTTYGCKGQALSSLLDVCKKLKIETKTKDGACHIKVFENGVASPVQESDTQMNGSGTTITVFDFLCTMPVRRKRINEVFDIEEMKNQLQYLAVIHNKVAFTLRNENKNLILLQKKSTPTVLQSISQIFKDEVTEFLKPISYQDKKFKISGFVSLKQQSQSLQLLYVNKRVITKGVIHKFVNNILKKYFADDIEEPFSDKVYKKIKKKSNNVFIIEIKCSQSFYEIFINLRKTTVEFKNWKEVLKCVHKAVRRAFKSSDTSSKSGSESFNKKEETKLKKKLGVSILNNIVKGAPVKRLLNEKQDFDDGDKKRKISDSDTTFLKPKDKMNELSSKDNRLINLSDSLETPIPRRSLSKIKNFSCEKNCRTTPNKSFLQFYEWLKWKFEKDAAAVNLYKEFLSKKKEGVDERVVYKHPLKTKELRCGKKTNEKDVKCVTEFSYTATEREKIVEYTKTSSKVGKTTECKVMSSVRHTCGIPLFQQPEVDDYKKACSSDFFCHHLPHQVASPASSESFFKNLINFRNKTENINCSFIQVQQFQDMNISLTQTWKSHLKNNQKKCGEGDIGVESKKSRRKIQSADAIVQTSFCEDVQKTNAFVQTTIDTSDKALQQSFDLGDSLNVHRKKEVSCLEDSFTRNQISQEVPYPDFWNLSPEKVEQNEELGCSKREETGVKPSSSNDFICGQESNGRSHFSSSTSKETRTLAAMMTECLEEIGNVNENGNSNNCASSDYKMEGVLIKEPEVLVEKEPEKLTNISESPQLPKTIPIEEVQDTAPESVFCLTERHDFVPKGLSPTFFNSEMYRNMVLSPSEQNRIKFAVDSTENDLLASIKWEDECTGGSLKPAIPDGILDEMQLKAEKNLIYDENEILSASLTYCAVKVHKLLHSFTFTKELLSNVQILGQLDRKFIVAKIEVSVPKKMTLISLFDQHAVDERIRLEELLNDYLTAEGNLLSSSTNPHIVCELKESVVQVIPSFFEKLKSFGLLLSVRDEKTVEIKEIPKFLLDRHEKNPKVKNKSSDALTNLIQALITNVVLEATESRGTVTKVPNIIHNALCSEACRKAIKFNRSLTVENMEEMINKLKNCKLPFQCAHGRPSVIPIIDLEDFEVTENETLNTDSLKKFLNKKLSEDV